MAYVARRPKRRFEIRESVHTATGPRSRTLATFLALDDAILDRAAAIATRPFDRDEVRASARRAGAPVAPTAAENAARRLLAELRAGRPPGAGIRRLLLDELAGCDQVALDAGDSVADWVGATPDDRGTALRDLLALTDRLPRPRRASRLTCPPLAGRG
ncbi:MAG TPA: hypothetical protein VM030_10050 [Acidimicrobiales bacterium]|nr:hypothetical protein [Acidimicrobiales bacterium]